MPAILGAVSFRCCHFSYMSQTNATPPPAAEQALLQSYAAARQHAGAGVELVALQLEGEYLGLAFGSGEHAVGLLWRTLGPGRVAKDHFKTSPPTPLAMENAIAAVEDAVMPLRPLLPSGARLLSTDAVLRQIAALSGMVPAQMMRLSLEALEDTFNRLVSVVEGTPASRMGLPESPAFAATLLILRELMHHLHFDHLEVLGAD